MGRLKEWGRDWLDRSETQPADRKLDDPLTLLQRIVAAIAAAGAVLSSPAISLLAPDLNPNAAAVLRVLVAAATLAAVNYVVTAKDRTETISGLRSETVSRYRFSNTERWIARGVVGVALVVWLLNFVPAPQPARDCALAATVTWRPAGGAARPLYIALAAGGEARYPVEAGKPVAMTVPAAHLSGFSVSLLWSDGSRSDFGRFAGCPEQAGGGSTDGRATIDLAGG